MTDHVFPGYLEAICTGTSIRTSQLAAAYGLQDISGEQRYFDRADRLSERFLVQAIESSRGTMSTRFACGKPPGSMLMRL